MTRPAPGPARAELEAGLEKAKKPFARAWLALDGLGPLVANDGQPLSPAAVRFLFEAQSREKAMEPAAAVLPWLAIVDRERARDFATNLLRLWLASEQDSKDRWALVLAGALGDDRIANTLMPWIPKWCDGARHKLAEYASGAIALLRTDHALMLLDALRTRYRSRFRNVGAAARAAFERAAAARGLTPDELGDLCVPTLGFDADGQRTFTTDAGTATVAVLAGGKLVWLDAGTGKPRKSPPSGVPPEILAEVKELGKALRETRKAQALRLEQALVRQRRWTAARFEELFVQHPLARSFVGQLVFGVYDADGILLRSCRRYDNGVLADADGRLEELQGTDLRVGLVHPLELIDAQLLAWREHFTRNGVEPFFPQLDRPVHRADAKFGNRRELVLVEGKALAAGTFRGRAERRGFLRGSVVDAGGILDYWKEFPGCGVEVVLELEGMFASIDPMATVKLGKARFVRAGTVRRGSYVFDEVETDEPRVLTFAAVPPVVWSETIGDLRAIAGLEDSAGA